MRRASPHPLAKFRSRFELLEPRLVLSSSTSAIPGDYEIVVSQFPPIQPTLQADLTNRGFPESSLGVTDESLIWLNVLNTLHNPGLRADSRPIVELAAHFSENVVANRQQPDPGNDLLPPPLAAKAPDSGLADALKSMTSGMQSLARAFWFMEPDTSDTDTSTSELTSQMTYENRDAVFQEYWSDAILQRASSDGNDGDWGTESEMILFEEDESLSPDHNQPAADKAASLQQLVEQELSVVDVVLTDLQRSHVQLPQTDSHRNTARSELADPSIRYEGEGRTETERTPAEQFAARVEAGGMVFLDVEDYQLEHLNLAHVYAVGLEREGARPLGVEVTLGVYQAFDVGTASKKVNASVSEQSKGQTSLQRSLPETANQDRT